MQNTQKEYVTTDELLRLLRISRSTLSTLQRAGLKPDLQINSRNIRWIPENVMEFLKRRSAA